MTTVSELSTRVGGRLFGNESVVIQRVASLESAAEGDIAYVDHEKFFAAAESSRASCLIVPVGVVIDSECRIEVKNPKLAFALIAELLHPATRNQSLLGHTLSLLRNTIGDTLVCGMAAANTEWNTRAGKSGTRAAWNSTPT